MKENYSCKNCKWEFMCKETKATWLERCASWDPTEDWIEEYTVANKNW